MKVDFKKALDCYRARSGEFDIVDIPPLRYLMVDGRGDPNTAQEYADAVATVYPIAYSLKFASKKALDRDYVVPPLEALWWAADMDSFTDNRDKSRWKWTVMIMVPEWIEDHMFTSAIDAVSSKKTFENNPAALDRLRLDTLEEGRCAQTLHIGSYDDEAGVLAELHHEFIPNNRFRMTGKHHEIYLNDPRRVEPSKLRTILRQPIESIC